VRLIANTLYGVPLLLYGIGIAFFFSGIVWTAHIRRQRSIAIPRSNGVGGEDSTGQFDESRDVSIATAENDWGQSRTGSQRGVGSLFSDDDQRSSRQLPSRKSWNSRKFPWNSRKFLMGVIEWSLATLIYSWLVEQYNANVYMRTWVHGSFPFAEFLLNYEALVAIVALEAALVFWMWARQSRPGDS